MKNAVLFAIAPLFALTCGCTSLLNLKEPKIEDKELKVESYDERGLKLNLILGIQNPNDTDFPLKDLEADLSIDDQPFLQRTWKELPTLAKNAKTTVNLPLEIEWGRILTAGLKFATLHRLPYRLKGHLNVKGFSVPFDEKGELSQDGKK